MKRFINILGAVAALMALCACESGIEKTIVTVKGTPGAFAVDLTTPYVCYDFNAEETAFTATWQSADLGDNVACAYSLQLDITGNNFASPVEISAGSNTKSKAVTSEQLSSALLRLGVPNNEAKDLDVRIVAKPFVLGSITPTEPVAISPAKATINAMTMAPPSPMHLIGRLYSSSSSTYFPWSTTNYRFVMFRDDPLGVDKFITQFDGTQASFKFVADAGIGRSASVDFWDYGFGKTADATGVLVINSNGAKNIEDIKTMGTGYYMVTADFNAMTYSIQAYDASSAATYTSITMDGTALAAPVSMNVLYKAGEAIVPDPHQWYADEVTLNVGTLTFESNTGTAWGGSTFAWGKGSTSLTTINIPRAGKYFIRFCDLTGHYVFYWKKAA